MALYSYVKKEPKRSSKVISFISYGSIVAGSLFLFWSFYPIIFFEIYSQLFIKRNFTSPVPEKKSALQLYGTESVLGANSIFSTNLSDYTKAGLWFPSLSQDKNNDIKIREYTVSIPRLNIEDAKVIVGGEDLNQGLIHYAPKGLPGQNGNVAIFGHSKLPQLAKPGLDYTSIFTYLPSLKLGDKISIKIQGTVYTYEVIDMFVVKPDQVSVLDQVTDDAYVTFFTCVPPGTYRLRLGVKTKLVRNSTTLE